MGNFNEKLLIPHQFELMKFFENFHMMKYPKEPILMLKRKCKWLDLGLNTLCSIVFIVQYEQEVIHAVDGLGSGVIIIPVMANFIVRVYTT